jgi:DeoR/GlpR family transcriptional regulator of sugar metabolism
MHLLPMFSEKTVRNDLNALVNKGYLKRKGKAPRSVYVMRNTK